MTKTKRTMAGALAAVMVALGMVLATVTPATSAPGDCSIVWASKVNTNQARTYLQKAGHCSAQNVSATYSGGQTVYSITWSNWTYNGKAVWSATSYSAPSGKTVTGVYSKYPIYSYINTVYTAL